MPGTVLTVCFAAASGNVDHPHKQGQAADPGDAEQEGPVQHEVHLVVGGRRRAGGGQLGKGRGGAALLVGPSVLYSRKPARNVTGSGEFFRRRGIPGGVQRL